MISKVAGVVVLYNPDFEVIENILTYVHNVEKLFVVDNSEETSTHVVDALISQLNSSQYIRFNQNFGIAKALNAAASMAVQEGFEWLLMMDQDSSSSEEMVMHLVELTKTLSGEKIGIVAPRYIEDSSTQPTLKVEKAYTVITSGSLLNLRAYKKVGGFRNDLFIDFVDHEYCLRLLQHGYQVLVSNAVKLNHKLGNLSCHNFFGWKLCTSNHNYLRRYYITRNRLEILRQFKGQFPDYLVTEKNKNLVEIIKVIFFEKDKLRKLKSFFLGYMDYKRRKFGKYSYK